MDDLDMASSVTSITEELATALDLKRHQMSFADVNPISKEELEKITTVMKGGSHLCDKIKPEILEEAASTSGSVFRLDEDTTKMTQVMAEYVTIYETIYCLVKWFTDFLFRCQRVSASTIERLGQEIFLSHDSEREFKNVSDICNWKLRFPAGCCKSPRPILTF